MQKITTLLLVGLVLILAGCTTKKPSDHISITGEFESVRGVMNNLSCYCANGAYIIVGDSEKVPICFEDDTEINCKNITVDGFYENKTINPSQNNPCPAGEMKYLKASSYKCN